MVTPLNGEGSTFQQVQFYINGSLVHSQLPAEDGTVSWFWDVSTFPGTNIKIVVIGNGGQTVTQTFQVKIANSASAAIPATSPSVLQQIISTPRKVIQSISHAIGKLPSKVKYGLPYFLFLLLGGDVFLLLYRTRHEVAESKRLEMLLTRERQNAELKHTFTQLVSHYLRTPLTIIGGSLELAVQGQSIASPVVSAANNSVQRLNVAIDGLLSQLSAQKSANNSQVTQPNSTSLWQQISLFVPIGLTGVVIFYFDYLVRHSSDFSVGQVNVIIQIVIFGSLSLLVYQIIRRRQLVRRNNAETTRLLEAETAFNNDRDQVIAYSATQIKKLADDLALQINQLQDPQAKRLADEGTGRLQQVIEKMMIANQLKGSHSIQPYVPIELEDLVRHAAIGLEAQLGSKAIQMKTLHNTNFQTQSKDLLITVLRTILDNAIAYSDQVGKIEISATLNGTTAVISVTDHGVGIPSAKKFSLFQAFSKTEGAETFNHEGMGFSLYLDKLIMNYLVGDIAVESAPQQGTRVLLTLPQPLRA
jgi:signal transduction histidine kinase